MNVNGWSVIEKLLLRRRKNQSDIARLLGISPAAVTQIKQGEFQLNTAALEKILRYLGATSDEQNEFYSQVVQSRIFEKANSKVICKIIIIKKEGH